MYVVCIICHKHRNKQQTFNQKLTTMKKEKLLSAAKELNELLGLDPAIPTKKSSEEDEIIGGLKEAAEFIEEDDMESISEETIKVLQEIEAPGFEIVDNDDAGDDDDGDDDESTPVKKGKAKKEPKPEPVPAKKGKAKKEEVIEEDDDDDESAPVKKDKEKAPAKKKDAAPKKERGGQTELIRTCIRKKMKRDNIIKKIAEELGQSEAWATNRLKLYEKFYGDMGKDDKNL